MCKKEVEKCCCEEGFSNGAIKKNFEFENFSIFGNIMKNSSIVIRYNGHLKFNSNVKMYYVFNNDWNNVKKTQMNICKHDKNAYCGIIHIDEELNISIGFCNEDESNITTSASYTFKIAQNTINDIMKRYNFEANESLPTVQTENKHMNNIFTIFNKIKKILSFVFAD